MSNTTAKTNRYYLINRPDVYPESPAPAASESWLPARDVELEDEIGPYTRPVYGYVEYDEPLDFYGGVWKYDLLPADREELISYNQWRNEVGK